MKTFLISISLIFNLIMLSLFVFFIYTKGGLPYLAEKLTQTRETARSKLASSQQPVEKFSDLTTIKLMPAETDRGMPLMQVLKERKSGRSYADQEFTLQDLSNLLWAADGITRENGKRTAPSARNLQEFTIYVIVKDGIYSYDPVNNELIPIIAGDFRKYAGLDTYVATAPVNLIYVDNQRKRKNDNSQPGCRIYCRKCCLVLHFGRLRIRTSPLHRQRQTCANPKTAS